MLNFKMGFNLYSVSPHFTYISAEEEGISARADLDNSGGSDSLPSLPVGCAVRITHQLPVFLPEGSY